MIILTSALYALCMSVYSNLFSSLFSKTKKRLNKKTFLESFLLNVIARNKQDLENLKP